MDLSVNKIEPMPALIFRACLNFSPKRLNCEGMMSLLGSQGGAALTE
jgi:hypothetical protein